MISPTLSFVLRGTVRSCAGRPTALRLIPCHFSLFTSQPQLFLQLNSSRNLSTFGARHAGESSASHAHDFDAQESDFREKRAPERAQEEEGKKSKTPWHREGSDLAPVSRERSAGAMTKGKLLTTPSRLLKLVLPLTTLDENSDRKDIEPLALLVHPQQPLSYLERLIQSELPHLENDKGEQKLPAVHFRAEDFAADEDSLIPGKKEAETGEDGKMEETRFGDQTEKTGKLNRSITRELRGGPGEGGVESYSGLGHERSGEGDASSAKFVRWSSSTEVGDFIRDAARGKEFAVEIEGHPKPIYVGVPSFNDRTYYLRTRLRKTSRKIAAMATTKSECDLAAHQRGQRIAMSGFGLLAGWWYVVYRLTFETDLGWDTMEPVTYLVGLTTIMGGYGWFLYHNREMSYRSALNLTISRNRARLYHARGFDLPQWESLVEEGNALRKEIKAVAREYDVEWDEKIDEQDERVTEALEQDRNKKEGSGRGKSTDRKDEDHGEDD